MQRILVVLLVAAFASAALAQMDPMDPEDRDRIKSAREDVVIRAPKAKTPKAHRHGTDLDKRIVPAGKVMAVPFFDQDFVSGPRPAVAEYEVGTMLVAAGKPYRIPVYWLEEDGKPVPTPDWARHQVLGAEGVSVNADGTFGAKKNGILVILFWDVEAPQIRWASSVEVEVKK